MATTGLGVTIGNYSLRAVKMRKKGDGYVVQRVFSDRLNDDTRPVAGRALSARGFRGSAATVGLTGRDVIIRYSQVPPVPEWRLRNLMKYEVDEVGSQSGGDVSADYRKLMLPDPDGERGDDTILVALARNAYLDGLLKACSAGGVKVTGTCPNSVALFNAFAVNATYGENDTCLLVNIGSENMDIAIQQGGELLFARNATPGGQAFTDAVQQAFSTTSGKAEQMKLAKADVTPRGQARYPDASSEKVANAIMGVAGQLASLIQSTLMIARAQAKLPDLKVDKVFLAGGGASLQGLDLYLKQAMGVPVERLDPFAISDLSQLTDDERALVEKAPHEFAVAVGLAQSRMDPLAFELEVLPAPLKRRRDFVTKGVFALAAAVVAAGILAVLYQARSAAAADGAKALRVLKRERKAAENEDKRFREVLQESQEYAAKHVVLADVMAPGALLGRAWKVLEKNLSDPQLREVYLHTVQLRVDASANEFDYFKPKRQRELASGYERVQRRYGERRDAVVLVEGRIAGRQRADAIYARFVDGCKGNDEGLIVVTAKRLRGGGSGRDGSFTLEFWPGTVIETQAEEGSDSYSVTLADLSLDDLEDPTLLYGRRADGVRTSIPLERINRRQRNALVADLQAQAAVDAVPEEDE